MMSSIGPCYLSSGTTRWRLLTPASLFARVGEHGTEGTIQLVGLRLRRTEGGGERSRRRRVDPGRAQLGAVRDGHLRGNRRSHGSIAPSPRKALERGHVHSVVFFNLAPQLVQLFQRNAR